LVAALVAGLAVLAARAGAGFFFSGAAVAFGGAAGVDAIAFGGVALLTTNSGAGDGAAAGAAGESGPSTGDGRGEGVAASVGSAVATGEDTGAGLALRRATTKPADATDTTSAATAAAMKRDPEVI